MHRAYITATELFDQLGRSGVVVADCGACQECKLRRAGC